MDQTLITQAAAIRDEQQEAANTNIRVGGLLVSILQVLGLTLTADNLSWRASATGVDLRFTVPSADGQTADQVVDLKVPNLSSKTAGVMTPAQFSDIRSTADSAKKSADASAALAGDCKSRADEAQHAAAVNATSIEKMESRIEYVNTKVNENADAINKLAAGGKVDLTGYVRKDDLEKVRLSAESNKTAIDKMNQSMGQPGGLCTLDDDGVVSIGNLPDEVFDVGVFHGIVELEEGRIETYKPSMGVLSPDTPGCHVVYDRTSGTFALCKVTDEDGEPVYIYYNSWVQAGKPIGKWSNTEEAMLPVDGNIYIDADTSTAYYCNGTKLAKVSAEGASSSGGSSGGGSSYTLPMATDDTLGGVKVGIVHTEDSPELECAEICREADGTITVPCASVTEGQYGQVFASAGAMSSGDAAKLHGIEEKAQVNVIEGIKVNGEYVPIDGHKDVDIEIPTAIGALDLGRFSSESAALAKLGDIDVCGRTDVTTIVLRYGDGDTNSMVCHQCIDGGMCRQVIFNKTKIFHRGIQFADGTRKNIQVKEDWQFLFMDRLEWDSLNDKYVPSQFGNTFNSSLCKPIPTATTITA